ncbi:ATP-binding cassette domain-containing protein [Paralimibaculum aggregatum]|uniref:ATP-binding cassette domain-containing protein n=1 Tax=Paralimibaculum aggregatum TaxID=3036245 RepID=A0ABQ6LQZ6_9RHOB|nr:oligopeptide/dipeptide ABC transporter ATP-binding protein [Limibaculum sp. NKW23]GMG83723.1 ATP-binding cassette domain-containing protein [Limibaculum sp. NKW23]
MSETVLEARGVRRSFSVSGGFMKPRRALHAVRGVDFTIRRGEVVGLVGESGCGKSTLAKLLLGLMPPSEGEILLEGAPISGQDRLETARRIQPIFQDPYSSLNPRKSIGTIIGLPLRVQTDLGGAEIARRVTETMDLVGLPARVVDSYPNQLSGGQRQRVAIARALINRPSIIICDEPTSALDVSVQSQILNLLQDLQREFGLTYLLISHDLSVVEHMASRVAVMYLGRIVEERPTAGLFAEARHPYARALLDSVLTPDPSLGIPDTHLGAAFPNPLEIPAGCSFHPRCPKAMPRCCTVAPDPLRIGDGMVECLLHAPDQHDEPEEETTR